MVKTISTALQIICILLCLFGNAYAQWSIFSIGNGPIEQKTGIAVDNDNNAHVTYRYLDGLNNMLSYTTNKNGEWTPSTIYEKNYDSASTHTITTDAYNHVHISFSTVYNTLSAMMYTSNSTGTWKTSSLIYSNPELGPCTGCANSIKVDANNKVHISHLYVPPLNNPSKLNYTTNANGTWMTATIDSGDLIGQTSIAIDHDGKVHIVYYDSVINYGSLKYATNASGSWATYIIDGLYSGLDNSIAIDSNNKVHVSYYEVGGCNLKYATNASGSWSTSFLETTGCVGTHSSIGVDSNDKVHISYSDHTNKHLKYITNESGAWVKSIVDSGSLLSYGYRRETPLFESRLTSIVKLKP